MQVEAVPLKQQVQVGIADVISSIEEMEVGAPTRANKKEAWRGKRGASCAGWASQCALLALKHDNARSGTGRDSTSQASPPDVDAAVKLREMPAVCVMRVDAEFAIRLQAEQGYGVTDYGADLGQQNRASR